MGINRVVARLPYFTGVPEDVVTNTFHYGTVATPTPTQIAAMIDGVQSFYDTAAPTDTVGEWIAPWVSRVASACQVEVYDLSDTPPRVPIGSGTFTLPAVSGTGTLPAETAMCLSFRAAYVSGEPNARRRGRVYIGPLSSSALNPGSGTSFPVPTNSFITNLLNAASDSLNNIPGAEGCVWGVYSPTDNINRKIIEAWVDNAVDTQRRRGNAPTSRTTISIS